MKRLLLLAAMLGTANFFNYWPAPEPRYPATPVQLSHLTPHAGTDYILYGHAIELNRATADQLATLSGIGPKLAERIIAYRNQHGPFKNFAELDAVPGIGPKLLAKLQSDVFLNSTNP